MKLLEENFLIINGDTLTDLDYHELFQLHLREKNIMTIATSTRSVGIDYGVIRLEENRNIIAYTEKPEMQFLVAMGVNVLSKNVLDLIPSGTRYDFPQLVLELIKQKMPIRCYRHKGYWLDIGRPEDYRIAVEQFEKNRGKFLGEENNTDKFFVENCKGNRKQEREGE